MQIVMNVGRLSLMTVLAGFCGLSVIVAIGAVTIENPADWHLAMNATTNAVFAYFFWSLLKR